MKLVKGSKTQDINKAEFVDIATKFGQINIDIGTGDGRYVYKNALLNPTNLYIGIDPSIKQLEIYSKKANKNKVENVLFVVGAVEDLPKELHNTADVVSVIFPWGTLLQAVAVGDKNVLRNIRNLLKETGRFVVVFGYEKNFEPTETERLELPDIDPDEVLAKLSEAFEGSDIKLDIISTLEIKEMESTWGKKLRFNPYRRIYRVSINL